MSEGTPSAHMVGDFDDVLNSGKEMSLSLVDGGIPTGWGEKRREREDKASKMEIKRAGR